MKTKEQAIEKAQTYLADLPSGWIYVIYQVGMCAPGIPDAPNPGEWFFTLTKGPLTLLPKENCTRWEARVGERLGEVSGPWETEGDSVTMKGALEKECLSVQKFAKKGVDALINMNEALKGIDIGDVK